MATRSTSSSKPRVIGKTRSGEPVYSTAKTSAVYKAKGTKHGKEAMVVPIGLCTLPSPFYTYASKQLYLKNNNRAVYVIGNTYTSNNKKLYIVARLYYMGGKPAVVVNGYRGYNLRSAWITFNSLPFNLLKMGDKNNKVHQYQSDGTYDGLSKFNQRNYTGFRSKNAPDDFAAKQKYGNHD